jgi:hypothetical protein
VLDCLEYLRDYSLVLTGEVAGVIRFRFLETLREFAWEQLGEDEREQLSQRHADYFLRVFCPAAQAGLGPEPDPRWLRRLEAEQENIGPRWRGALLRAARRKARGTAAARRRTRHGRGRCLNNCGSARRQKRTPQCSSVLAVGQGGAARNARRLTRRSTTAARAPQQVSGTESGSHSRSLFLDYFCGSPEMPALRSFTLVFTLSFTIPLRWLCRMPSRNLPFAPVRGSEKMTD